MGTTAAPKRKPKLYEPKFDFGIPSRPLPLKEAVKEGKKFGQWVKAPGSSHLKEFRLVLPSPAAVKPGGTVGVPFPNPKQESRFQPAWIDVKFRATKSAPESWYAYKFEDLDEAERAFELLTDAEHPGEVIHSYFIANGIPYKKVA